MFFIGNAQDKREIFLIYVFSYFLKFFVIEMFTSYSRKKRSVKPKVGTRRTMDLLEEPSVSGLSSSTDDEIAMKKVDDFVGPLSSSTVKNIVIFLRGKLSGV